MSKLPAMQFYVGDWRKDPGVQALGYFERGVWFEMLCLMHESENRGELLLNGRPMPEDALARTLGLDKQMLTTTLTKILEYGVAKKDKNGVIFSKRMKNDEKIRKIRQKAGKMGGNPQLLKGTKTKAQTVLDNQIPTTGVKQILTPSSSSSISSSLSSKKEEEKKEQPEPKRSAWVDKAREVFEYWTVTLNKPSHKFTAERKNKIIARLKDGYSVDDIKTAIEGISLSPHNMGQNDRGVEYNDLELICRTGTHVEKYRDMKVKGLTLNRTNGNETPRDKRAREARESLELLDRIETELSEADARDSLPILSEGHD